MPLVLGLDPSLLSTGYCLPNGTAGTIKTGTRKGVERLQYIRHVVLDLAMGLADIPPVDLVVIEAFAFGTARQAYAYEIGGLGWILRVAFDEAGVNWLEVPPATLKRFATGRGSSPKEAVLAAAIRKLDFAGSSFDEADASWLRAIGMELLGEPVVKLPRGQVAALDALREKAA